MQLSIRKVSFLVGLPLAALALALFVMSLGNGVTKVHAAVDPVVKYSISTTGCDSDGVAVCNIPAGSTFTVSFNLATPPTGGYDGYDLTVAWSGSINYLQFSMIQPQPSGTGCIPPASAGSSTTCFYHDIALGESFLGGTLKPAPNNTELNGPASLNTGGAQSIHQGAPRPSSTYTGSLLTFQMVCKSTPGATGTITVKSPNGTDILQGATPHSEAADESLTVNCVPAPTATPPPPTPTPPAIPRVQKTCVSKNNATPSPRCNVFLTRQGPKIPPATCEQGTNAAILSEGLSGSITTLDPKGLTGFQKLGAFQFEVRFDPNSVCVSVAPGPDWTAVNNAICSTVAAKGIVRFGCVTAKKGHTMSGLLPAKPLAFISVRPQPRLYSVLRPNQDNGIPVQIMNQGCQLADEQGHTIPIFSCESADITFRFLEGSVSASCSVSVVDAQAIAFRWGAALGSLLYTPFMDLVPSGQIKGDGVIDIKDLQFVFGRLNSTCTRPWPAQLPVNPKA